MRQSYDVNTKLMLINHVKKRDNCLARKFRVLETKCDDADHREKLIHANCTQKYFCEPKHGCFQEPE
jgi:hypothetical protein